jgi:hypothetical protein
VQKCVNLVDLVKSFQTSIYYYLLAKCGFDTAENEPPKRVQKIYALKDPVGDIDSPSLTINLINFFSIPVWMQPRTSHPNLTELGIGGWKTGLGKAGVWPQKTWRQRLSASELLS